MEALKALHPEHITYLVMGREIAPSTGTPHLQIYMEMKTRWTLGALKTHLHGIPLHLIASRGTAEENLRYCTKEDPEPTILGEPMRQGSRTDLSSVRTAIEEGTSISDLWKNYFETMVRYHAGILKGYQYLSAGRELDPPPHKLEEFKCDIDFSDLGKKSYLLWGPSDIGKSCFAKALLPKALFVSHIDDLREYKTGEYDGIIFDDMDFKHFPRSGQIHLVDCAFRRSIHTRYEVSVIPAKTKKIFLANYREIFLDDPAINRRLKISQINRLF